MKLQGKLGKKPGEGLAETILHQEALINCTQDMVWSVDKALNVIVANQAFKDTIKSMSGVVIDRGSSVLIEEFGSEQLDKWKSLYLRALSGEQLTVKEHFYNPAKQGIEYSLISLSPLMDEENRVIGVACFGKDVTTDISNLSALESARARLEKIMDSSMDMICAVDENDRILSVNAASEKILGYKPEEMIGKRLFDFLYPEDLENTRKMASDVMAGHDMTDNENRYVRKDGSLVPLMWSARWDPKDRIRYGIARDATERKKNEEALVESEKKYRYMFDKNPLPVLMWDFETLQVLDCNEAAIAKYGYSKNELLQLSITDLWLPEDVPLLEKIINEDTGDKEFYQRNWRHRKKSGEISYMDITGQALYLGGKKVSLMLANDVTESRYFHELYKLERSILELNIRKDKSFQEIIDIYLLGIENLHPGLLCSMQEIKGGALHNLRAPSLPKAYLDMIEGLMIGDNVGSCGTAAFRKQKVIVADIENDFRWADYKDLARQFGLAACWSFPVIDNKGDVMATFACYYRQVREPSALEENTVQRAANILQILLENDHRERALRLSNERFEYATQATSDIIWDWNLETNQVYYSGNIEYLFGHKPGLNNDNLPFYFEHVHPDDRQRVVLYPDEVRYGSMVNWSQEYRFKKANGEYAFVLDKGIVIRDKNGIGLRMIGAMQDITLMKENELRVLQQNEKLTEIALINAHQIRKPVATILGLMQLLNENTLTTADDREVLAHLKATATELDEVIKRIIDKAVS